MMPNLYAYLESRQENPRARVTLDYGWGTGGPQTFTTGDDGALFKNEEEIGHPDNEADPNGPLNTIARYLNTIEDLLLDERVKLGV